MHIAQIKTLPINEKIFIKFFKLLKKIYFATNKKRFY